MSKEIMQGKERRHDKYYFSARLRTQLERIPAHVLTVVEAPSGFGKTTAVREYFARREYRQADIRWYTCFGESPSKAWAGICKLFADARSDMVEGLLEAGVPTLETLPDIVNVLKQYRPEKPVFLVIDNYQLFKSDVPRDFIQALASGASRNVHLVIITQPLPPTRQALHGEGEQFAIASANLLFDDECILNYCRLTGIDIPAEEIGRIREISGGWVAVVRLQIAAYAENGSLADTRDINALIDTAIWSGLAEADRDFLLTIALLDNFTAGQAAIMGGWPELPEHAARLLSSNFFIRHIVDKKAYSVHALLREYLLRRFETLPRERADAMRRRAAAASCEAGEYFEAAQFFMQLADYEAILSLPFTTQYFYNIKERSVIEFFERLIDTCPEDILHKYPIPLVLIAYLFFRYGLRPHFAKTTEVIAHLLAAPGNLSEKDLARAKAEFSMLMSFTEYNDIIKMSAYHRQAYAYLKTISTHPRSLVFQGAMPWAVGLPSVMAAYWNKSGNLRNELDAMDDCLPIYSELADGHGAGAEHVFRAEAELGAGNDKAAETLCHKALYRARDARQFGVCLCAELILAEIAVLRGDGPAYAAARSRLAATAEEAGQRSVSRMGELCLAVLDLNLGRTEALPGWLRSAEGVRKILYAHAIPYGLNIHCQLLLLEERHAELYALAEQVMEQVQSAQLGRNMNYVLPQVHIGLYLAAAKKREGHAKAALAHLESSLRLALPDKIYLPFAKLAPLLPLADKDLRGKFAQKDLAGVDALCKKQAAGAKAVLAFLQGGIAPLTAREREVAQLAKERLSAREIALHMGIAPSTVNTLLKRVYRKLGIHSKSDLARLDF